MYRLSVSRHIDQYSSDMSVVISTGTQSTYRLRYVGGYDGRDTGRYVGRDINGVTLNISVDIATDTWPIC